MKELREAVFQSRNQSILEGLKFLSSINSSKTEGKKQFRMFQDFLSHFATNQQISFFPWCREGKDYYTPFLDLIELYDFIIEDEVS